MDLPIEEGWDLICDSQSVQLMQPTPKTRPLSRPDMPVQPRLQASLQVSPVSITEVPQSVPAGPRLTLAAISVAEPRSTPAYQPIRGNLIHHVSHVGSPYLRNHRTEYHPASLTMSASPSRLSEPSVPTRVFSGVVSQYRESIASPSSEQGSCSRC